ncbi:MAG: helix-turn-helix domain-containing protein [Nocardioides sp.]|uniref:TetR/AcrR family transcriptional regulator n=1 Tax=Nocardioides sp. TaxID=35761 RepID=UPI0039E2898C
MVGLRERKAAQTRARILEVALDAFEAKGYEATTMEEIAEGAEVGASTLYRYFPTKEALLVEPLGFKGTLAEALRSRPTEEALGISLGHAIQALFDAPRPDRDRLQRIGAVIDANTGPRLHLHELLWQEAANLRDAIAERTGRDTDDVYCEVTAHLTVAVLRAIAERTGKPSDPGSSPDRAAAIAADLLARLHDDPPELPVFGRPD